MVCQSITAREDGAHTPREQNAVEVNTDSQTIAFGGAAIALQTAVLEKRGAYI
jgi:hypothetical protein